MKNFKGTQGKWQIIKSTSTISTHVKCGKTRIAEVKHYNKNIFHEGINIWDNDPELKEGQANANLIAASPELLEALQNLLTCVEEQSYMGSDTELAQQVINKALGQ